MMTHSITVAAHWGITLNNRSLNQFVTNPKSNIS